jgi:predicted NAD/FAD-dependent oxidoreductase
LRGAEAVFPGIRDRVRARRLHREAEATATFDVGRYRGIARFAEELEKRSEERRTFFCGDYLVAPHAEGAATSALRAADQVLRTLEER